jgi:hypothetical protein
LKKKKKIKEDYLKMSNQKSRGVRNETKMDYDKKNGPERNYEN